MTINSASTAFVAALLLTGLWIQPALAHPGGGGGGGGHSSAAGGHAFAGHGGYGGSHAGGGHIAAQHFAAAGRGYSPGRSYAPAAGIGHGAMVARAVGPGATRGDYGRPGYYARGGYGRGGYGHGSVWGGGYWGGRFWPGVYYGAGFAWFLPVLPLYCSTYWWNNVPYYYYNDAYYTWSPTADGYVATDPPPVAASADAPTAEPPAAYPPTDYDGSGGTNAAAAAPGAAAPGPGAPVTYGGAGPNDHVFAYPVQGQSQQQQAADRQQCDQWAAAQTQGTSSAPDFQRAVIACFTGRGYSAQ